MKKIAFAVVLSAMVAAPAVAAETYVGVKAGTNQMDYTNVKSSTAFGVLGGYAINENVAAEVGYTNLGSADVTGGTSVTGNVISLSAVGSMPVSKDISLNAKIGFASSTIDSAGSSYKNSGVIYGIGAQYNVSKTMGATLGYESFKVGDSTITEKSSALITIGVVFKM